MRTVSNVVTGLSLNKGRERAVILKEQATTKNDRQFGMRTSRSPSYDR